MGKPLNVLIVEDAEDDALLLVRHLERGGFEPVFERVDDTQGMSAALAAKTWDVILCDYTLPRFSVSAALALLPEAGLDLPFIVVSGMIGEERAVDVMKAGIHDLILKDNLARLVPAIERELSEAENRRKRRQSEEALQEKTRLIQLLQTIAVAANEAATVDEAMQVCLDAVCAHTGWPIGHGYMLAEGGGQELVPTNLWHLDNPVGFKAFQEVTRKTRFMPGIGLPGRVLASGEPAWITDVTEDPNFPRAKLAQDIGVKAGFGFPVVVGESVVGVLEFFSTDAVEPDEEMLEAMGHIGTQLGRVVEREQAEKAEAQLRQAQKMEAVGQLTGGIAHDFNNLLTVILGNLQLLERRVEGDAKVHKRIHAATDAALRGAELTKRLLAFSRRQVLKPKVVDLNKLVSGMDDPLRRTLGEAIEIKTTLSADLLSTCVDLNQLESALLNLAINARDAMPRGGKLTIETAHAFLDEDYAARHAEVTAGDYVMLAVSDSGAGMSADVIEHAFEPFFTTKEVGKGSGLGLSMVYGFVKQSSGHIKIYSEEGHGTTVKLYLPRAKPGDEAEGAAPEAALRTGGETILVVEDEAAVREIAVALLEERGYRVLEAEDGPVALKILDEHPDIDLLLTDVVMPGGMGGADLARNARERRPDLKVLYTSGYTENAMVHRGALDEGVEIIGKPYQKDELAHKVRRVLDS